MKYPTFNPLLFVLFQNKGQEKCEAHIGKQYFSPKHFFRKYPCWKRIQPLMRYHLLSTLTACCTLLLNGRVQDSLCDTVSRKHEAALLCNAAALAHAVWPGWLHCPHPSAAEALVPSHSHTHRFPLEPVPGHDIILKIPLFLQKCQE